MASKVIDGGGKWITLSVIPRKLIMLFVTATAARVKSFFGWVGIGLGLWISGQTRSEAMTFNLSYDSSVTSLTNAAQVEAAMGQATAAISNIFTNQITIYLGVYWGNTGPFSNGVGLGASLANLVGTNAGNYYLSYAQVTNALRSLRNSADDSNSVSSLIANDPLATNGWWLPMAEARALRCFPATGTNNTSAGWTGLDGAVGFGSTIPFTFSPTNRTVPGAYDFIGLAEHEITEVMGRTARLNRFGDGTVVPFDLFRYTNSGGRSGSPNDQGVYFSVNKGQSIIRMFYTNMNTGDVQDWLGSIPADAFDDIALSSTIRVLGPADITALDVLGYNAPIPSTNFTTTVGWTNGGAQISFTNTPGATFSVLGTTNVNTDITNWFWVGTPTQGNSGHYFFFDPVDRTGQSRFYRVRAP